jgi:DNA-binding NarL/FixJ family response regulator
VSLLNGVGDEVEAVPIDAEVRRLPDAVEGKADVLVTALPLADGSDIAALAAVAPVVVVVQGCEVDAAVAAVRQGANGVVDAAAPNAVEQLSNAVAACARGASWFPSSVQRALAGRVRKPAVDPLTKSEHRVVELVVAGLKNAEVARRLFVTQDTVKKHVSNALSKLGLRDWVALVLWSIKQQHDA